MGKNGYERYVISYENVEWEWDKRIYIIQKLLNMYDFMVQSTQTDMYE